MFSVAAPCGSSERGMASQRSGLGEAVVAASKTCAAQREAYDRCFIQWLVGGDWNIWIIFPYY